MARKQKMHSPLKIFAIITNCKYCVEYQNNKVIQFVYHVNLTKNVSIDVDAPTACAYTFGSKGYRTGTVLL